MCLASLQGRDKIISVCTERPPWESSEMGVTAMQRTVTVSEHRVRLGCFPLTSIGSVFRSWLHCRFAMQSRGEDILILENMIPGPWFRL